MLEVTDSTDNRGLEVVFEVTPVNDITVLDSEVEVTVFADCIVWEIVFEVSADRTVLEIAPEVTLSVDCTVLGTVFEVRVSND
jgi:hypothetical protein